MPNETSITRRQCLRTLGSSVPGLALAHMLATDERGRRIVHHPARARAVIELFMSGAASAVDLYDHKPLLAKKHGEPWDPGEKVELFQSNPGTVMASPWPFRRAGDSDTWISTHLPQLASCVDRIAFVRSMTSPSNVHGPATLLGTTGFQRPGFPSFGSWVSHALGHGSRSLPTYCVLPDSRGFAPCGPQNWASTFLSARHQGMLVRPEREHPIANLEAPAGPLGIAPQADRDARELLERLNTEHAARRPHDERLRARIASYALAGKLQLEAPRLLDLRDESESTRRLYGLERDETREFGTRCLLARRLVERGVPFVQVWSGADNGFPRRNWDSHEDLARDHGELMTSIDQPMAALLLDLERRGLLDETVVLWNTEFGRMPCSQGSLGRDHNPFAFTCWMAGGGLRGGTSRGETDEWSYRVVRDSTTIHDLHATILHLLGIDHERLTVRHDGIDRRVTDVFGHVLHELIA